MLHCFLHYNGILSFCDEIVPRFWKRKKEAVFFLPRSTGPGLIKVNGMVFSLPCRDILKQPWEQPWVFECCKCCTFFNTAVVVLIVLIICNYAELAIKTN